MPQQQHHQDDQCPSENNSSKQSTTKPYNNTNTSTATAAKSMMRKVRSLDSVRFHNIRLGIVPPPSPSPPRSSSPTHHHPYPPPPPPSSPSEMVSPRSSVASKFSRVAFKEKVVLRRRFSRGLLGLAPPPLVNESLDSFSTTDYDNDDDDTSCKKSTDPLSSSTHSINSYTGGVGVGVNVTTRDASSAAAGSSDSSGMGSGGGNANNAFTTEDDGSMGFILDLLDRLAQFQLPNNMSPVQTIAFLSILILLLVSLMNFALDTVHAQMHKLDSPFYYDALSTEVIVPPFRYKSPYSEQSNPTDRRKPRLGLGTAAIDSVTTALSPVLPFTGGVDLRRKEHWHLLEDEGGTEGWCWAGTVSSLAARTLGWFGIVAAPGDGNDGSSFSETVSSSSGAVPKSGGVNATKFPPSSKLHDPTVTMRDIYTKRRNRKFSSTSILATSTPFLSIDIIAQLTLGDVSDAFRYAIDSHRDGFDRNEFYDGLNDRMKMVVDAIDEAVTQSRGVGVEPPALLTSQTSSPEDNEQQEEQGLASHFGDVDALQFCAAMRIFAEWRLVRQVPEGYKGYAVGMALGHKDVVQNVAKIEGAVHGYVYDRREYLATVPQGLDEEEEEPCAAAEDGTDRTQRCNNTVSTTNKDQSILRSPTLRQLLQHETTIDLHPTSKLPRLKDNSAAMGILWVRRQLQYQTSIFGNIVQVPSTSFPNTNAAVSAAYREVYDRFHGWAVQKIFNYSFQAAPEADIITRFMNPGKLGKVMEEAGRIPVDENGEPIGEEEEGQVVMEETDTDEESSSSADSSEEEMVEDTKDEEQEEADVEEDVDDYVTSFATDVMALIPIQDGCALHDTEQRRSGVVLYKELPWWEQLGNHLANEWDKFAFHIVSEWDKLIKHVGTEWDKFASSVVALFQQHTQNGKGRKENGGAVGGVGTLNLLPSAAPSEEPHCQHKVHHRHARYGLVGEALERYITQEMSEDARRHIDTYQRVAQPLLGDLAGLFEEMNMDDPTKV